MTADNSEPRWSRHLQTDLPAASPTLPNVEVPRHLVDNLYEHKEDRLRPVLSSQVFLTRNSRNNRVHKTHLATAPKLPINTPISRDNGHAHSCRLPNLHSTQQYGFPLREDPEMGPRSTLRRRSQLTIDVQIETPRIGTNFQASSISRNTSEDSASFTSRASTMAGKKAKKQSKMLRELKAHNDSPEPETEAEAGFDFDGDTHAVRKTRNVTKTLGKLAKKQELSPKKTQNVLSLMLEQFNPDRGRKTYYPEGSSEVMMSSPGKRVRYNSKVDFLDEEEEVLDNGDVEDSTHEVRRSRRQSSSPRSVEQDYSPVPISQFIQDTGRKAAWKVWENQKERINQLLDHPRYNPRPLVAEHRTAQGIQRKPSYYPAKDTQEIRRGLFHVDNGLFVFTPTATEFKAFANFLQQAEEIAGRENGVVKVIVPRECVLPFPPRAQTPVKSSSRRYSDQGASSFHVTSPALKVKLALDKTSKAKTSPFYSIFATPFSGPSSSDLCLHLINRAKDHLIEKYEKKEAEVKSGNLWKYHQARKPYGEPRMIRKSAEEDKDIYCVSDEPATSELRSALHIGDPNLQNYIGNRFSSSLSSQPGINEPVFHLPRDAGAMFPLQLGKFSAYTLNYHHKGAPRRYTVVKPLDHEAVEQLLHRQSKRRLTPEQDRIATRGRTPPSEDEEDRPQKPPSCAQFVKHQPTYVPCQTLELHEIHYTHFTQFQGEMVIIFPYAYHQGFNAGPNITEEVMYASDRWEVFHREKLYQHCSRNCAGGKAESFDLDFVKKGILSPRDHRHRRRTQELSVTIAQQLGDTAEDEEEEEEEEEEIPSQRRRPKASPHSAGLRAMDRVDDDGEWEETYLGNNPNGGKITRRNKKGQVAAQGKTDMWNVESVLGDADDEASPFITPKNPLKRGRDRALEDFDGQRPLSGAEKRARKGY